MSSPSAQPCTLPMSHVSRLRIRTVIVCHADGYLRLAVFSMCTCKPCDDVPA